MTDRIDAFLAELEALSQKYRLRIVDGSCGCCGYTSLMDTDTQETMLDTNDWNDTRLYKAL